MRPSADNYVATDIDDLCTPDEVILYGETINPDELNPVLGAIQLAFEVGLLYGGKDQPAVFLDDPPRLVAMDLSEEQQVVHDVIERHLRCTLAGHSPPQLLLIVRGAAGTGKTTVVQELATTFHKHGAEGVLDIITPNRSAGNAFVAKSAESKVEDGASTPAAFSAQLPTDCYASLVPSTTASLLSGRTFCYEFSPGGEAKALDAQYIMVDGYTSLTKTAFAHLAESLEDGEGGVLFGGRNVILFGDIFGTGPSLLADALHSKGDESALSAKGASAFRGFTEVCKLGVRVRCEDDRWDSLLDRVRLSACTAQDITVLRSRLIGIGSTAFAGVDEWPMATLVTSDATLARVWNKATTRLYTAAAGVALYLSPCSDEGPSLTDDQRARLCWSSRGGLAGYSEVAVGMSVIADIGTCTMDGKIVEVVLDPREPAGTGAPLQILYYPVVRIVVKAPYAGENTTYDVARRTVNFSWSDGAGAGPVALSRTQFNITAGYALEAEDSATYTFDNLVVDLVGCSGQEAYAMLSRVRSTSALRLLRDFEEAVLTAGVSGDVMDEDSRLDSFEEK